MNPHQKNKVDISSLSPDEQRLFRLYGKLPNRNDLLQNKLKERKYFDSGDYALSKAGKASDVGVTQIGREHPNPDTIPHLASSPHGNGERGSISGPSGSIGDRTNLPPGAQMSGGSGSPVKESSMMHRSESIDDQPGEDGVGGTSGMTEDEKKIAGSVSPPPQRQGMPIRGSN